MPIIDMLKRGGRWLGSVVAEAIVAVFAVRYWAEIEQLFGSQSIDMSSILPILIIIALVAIPTLTVYLIMRSRNRNRARPPTTKLTNEIFVENTEKTGDKQIFENTIDVSAHKNNLISQIPETPIMMGIATNHGWIGWIDQFSHRRKLLEHLITGHKELFNLLDCVMTLRDEKIESAKIIDLVTNKIREEARIAGIPLNPSTNEPSFNYNTVANHVISSIVEKRQVRFAAKHPPNTNESYLVDNILNDNTLKYPITYSNQSRLADDLAIGLNRIASQDEVKNAVLSCQGLEDYNAKEREKFNSEFARFLNNVRLDKNNLKGACKDRDDTGCLKYYDESESQEYRKVLAELDKIDWVNKFP